MCLCGGRSQEMLVAGNGEMNQAEERCIIRPLTLQAARRSTAGSCRRQLRSAPGAQGGRREPEAAPPAPRVGEGCFRVCQLPAVRARPGAPQPAAQARRKHRAQHSGSQAGVWGVTLSLPSYRMYLLGWPKCSLRFFHTVALVVLHRL